MSRFVKCDEHGQSKPAYVCKHLVQTLCDQIPRGVIWSRDEDQCVNGYCDECEMRLDQAGGEWNDELYAEADIKLICEGCFRRVLSINKKTELN
jgi:hypothetical protein